MRLDVVGGFVMRKRRSRRLAACTGALGACVVGLTSYTTSAVAAPLTVHGSATDKNNCSVNVFPVLQPSSGSHRVAVAVSSDASPQPHGFGPITLSNTTVEVRVGGNLFQSGVDSGFLGDGFAMPATVTGSTSGIAVFFGLSCIAGGALLIGRSRKNWTR